MKTIGKFLKKRMGLQGLATGIFLLTVACSTVRENGEPNVNPANTTFITTDEQRKAIYERGTQNLPPQNANPIPHPERLGLNEQASEINRKKNIESRSDTYSPNNIPVEERPRQLRQTGNDTLPR